MAASARQQVIDWIGEELGTVRMWKVTILSGIGLVLVLGLVAMLAAIFLSGSATLDDLGVPLGILVLLTPVLAGGVVYGALGVRALRVHPLLRALDRAPPALRSLTLVQSHGWNGVRFVVESGEEYTLYAPSPDWAPFVIATLRG
ncbi:MAG: hypothetical protein K1X94_22520 [Sandaracinaceae bacterium]|nr:hypothetical protein [Sandaracinaceae bacterium]